MTRTSVRVAILVVGLVLAALVISLLVSSGGGPAQAVRSSASSTSPGTSAQAAASGTGEWRSDGETVGAWIELVWEEPVEVGRVVIEQAGPARVGVSAGWLAFSDGSRLEVRLSETSAATVVPITAREVRGLRFTVSEVAGDASSVALSRVGVEPHGGIEEDGREPVESSSGGGAGGAPWTLRDPLGASVRLTWPTTRELTAVSVAGSVGGSAVRRGTLTFSDGSEIDVGAVLADPGRPTVVAFMPRASSWVQLTVEEVEGVGPLVLDSLTVMERGADPAGPSGLGEVPSPSVGSEPVACVPGDESATAETDLVVLCPTSGDAVAGQVRVVTATAASYDEVTATLWPAAGGEIPPAVSAAPDASGTAELLVPTDGQPAGPLTLQVQATSSTAEPVDTYLTVNHVEGQRVEAPSDPPAGRSLVYADEFDGPLSVSREGAGTDYTAAKPETSGVSDFGDAGFGDPAAGDGTVTSVDGDYLRLSVRPRSPGVGEPTTSDPGLVAGMLASARSGGSGVSARYGYFEARMLLPTAPGTWPAFWLLPSPNLVDPEPVVAEIDAVEHYGHNPTGACHTTHQYPDPGGVGVAHCGERWDTVQDALVWHTFAVDVSPTEVTYYIDGERVVDAPQVEGGADPMFFLLDLALGGGWPVDLAATRDRADLYVDWVRIWV